MLSWSPMVCACLRRDSHVGDHVVMSHVANRSPARPNELLQALCQSLKPLLEGMIKARETLEAFHMVFALPHTCHVEWSKI